MSGTESGNFSFSFSYISWLVSGDSCFSDRTVKMVIQNSIPGSDAFLSNASGFTICGFVCLEIGDYSQQERGGTYLYFICKWLGRSLKDIW